MGEDFRIDVSNIRGLRANHFAVYAHVRRFRPNIMAVCETQVFDDSEASNYQISGYSLLPLFFPRRGLALYIRSDVAYQCQQQLSQSDPEFSALWVKLKLPARILHFCYIYRSPNIERDAHLSGLESLSNSISSILAMHPHSEIRMAGILKSH